MLETHAHGAGSDEGKRRWTPFSVGLFSLLLACGGVGSRDGQPVPTDSAVDTDTTSTETVDPADTTDASDDTTADPEDTIAAPEDAADTGGIVTDTAAPPLDCDFFAAPNGGGEGADGSAEHPWGSLESVSAAGMLPAAGGVLCLLSGHHGAPRISGVHPTSPLVIRAVDTHQATVSSLTLHDSADLTFQALVVDGATVIDPETDERGSFLVLANADVSPLALIDVVVQSADSSVSWTWNDWWKRSRSGVDLRGPAATVLNCTIRNVHHALSVRGDNVWVEGNTIDNFGGDGIRGLGSGSTYTWNTVRDAYIDEYDVQHDDAFQAYKLEGDLRISDVTIAHNQFLLFTDPLTDFVMAERLVGTLMQGIIITDGYADGWVVENNLVVNSQAHGISLYGARNSRIQNNTVVAHPGFEASSGAWIRITDQTKSGHQNFDNVIRNNLTAMLTPWDYDSSSTVEANLEVTDPDSLYVDGAAMDFHLRSGTSAVDAGIDSDLPGTDLDGAVRKTGAAVDLGAYERQ
ncbi:MAG: parallel beta-helix repeat protein [Myxococcota bacterium]